MNKTVLVGINAKFIHSNLAIRYMKAYYHNKENRDDLNILEYSINQDIDYILNEIVIKEPNIVTFSCYLWNYEIVKKLSRVLKGVLDEVTIVYGGPEVTYTSEDELKSNPYVDYIIQGEGEETFRKLKKYLDGASEFPTSGITYREGEEIVKQFPSSGLNMGDIPFPYDNELSGLANRILYYETSRGCPFNCQYCLSSVEKGVRFRPLHMVFKELDFFLRKNVRQVKLVDRTFNTKKEHALSIMEYIIANDNGVTNFHFEVAPELIGEEFINCLKKARKGLFQLEVGVQSINDETLKIIKRKNKLQIIKDVVKSVYDLENTHMHLDLIAGLPAENYESFGKSFDYVYNLKPDQLQLGFLKVLKGSGIKKMTEKYGIIYRDYSPYEVLKTNAISYVELEQLKIIEEMVELFYNSGQFQITINKYIMLFDSAFNGFEKLAKEWVVKGLHHNKHNKLDLFQFLYDIIGDRKSLMYDYCLNEKPRKKIEWMDYQFVKATTQRVILDAIKDNGYWSNEASLYNNKQLSRMYHIDKVNFDKLPKHLKNSKIVNVTHNEIFGSYMVVNYNRRNFIHNNGEVLIVIITNK